MEPSTPITIKRRPHASSSASSTPVRGPNTATPPRRPSVSTPKTPATTLKPKPPVPRFGLLTPQVSRTSRGSSSSTDSPPPESRLYSGSVCYITEDLLKRTAKTKNLNEVKQLRLSFPDSKVVHIENLDGLKRIESLDLSDNKIERVRNLQGLRYLRVLNLHSNLVSSVEGIELLSRLEELDLSSNLIERIPSIMKHLGALRTLKLQDNKISTLRDIVHLKQLKNLTDLTITPNPIMTLDHARLFIVFHLSSLHELDGELISDAEREEARERFAADELQQIEFEMHSAQLEAERLREQLASQEQRIQKLEAALKDSRTVSDELRAANEATQQELASTTALLDKKTAEVASLSELLYELKQEVAFYNIDSQFGSRSVPPKSRLGSGAPTESPYLGMGSARSRTAIDTPEKTMANLLSQLDAVANDEDILEQPESTTDDKSDTDETVAPDDKLDTESWIVESQPRDVSEELVKVGHELDNLQAQFYAALAEGDSEKTERLAAEIEVLQAKKVDLENEMRRFEEWNAEKEEKQREELETAIARMKAELQAKEEQLLKSKLKAQIASGQSQASPKVERRLSLEQVVKKDLPTDSMVSAAVAAAGGADSSSSPNLRELLALVEQDHISRIIALLGEVQTHHETSPDGHGAPRSLEEAIELLRKVLLSQSPSASNSEATSAREQGQPQHHDLALAPFTDADGKIPAGLRERLGQLEAQISMLEDAKLETFFSEGEDWEKLAVAMKALQQQNRLLNADNPQQEVTDDESPERQRSHELRNETTELQQKLAASMSELKQLWLSGKVRADPEVEKSAAWRYWTQMSQFQFFYFHLKMQLAHMNQMLQLRKNQLLEVQNRLIDAKYDQDQREGVVTSVRLVPLDKIDEVLATPSKESPKKPSITSIPPTPVSKEPEASPPRQSESDKSDDMAPTRTQADEPESLSAPADRAPTPTKANQPEPIVALADRAPTPTKADEPEPLSAAAVPAQPAESLAVSPQSAPSVAPAQIEETTNVTAPAVIQATAVAPATTQQAPLKKSPFVNSKPSTPVPAETPAVASDSKPAETLLVRQPSLPVLKISPSEEVKREVTPPQLVESLPQPTVTAPSPRKSDPAVQNLMQRLEQAASSSLAQGPAKTESSTSTTKPQPPAPTAEPQKVEQKTSMPEKPSTPLGKPPLAPTVVATPPPASSEPASSVKKSPFLLADKQRQQQSSTPPLPAPVQRTMSRTPSTGSSSVTPSPTQSPVKPTHRRSPSDVTPDLLSPKGNQTTDGSPKRTLSRNLSNGLMLKPASATVPGIFSMSGMSSPAGPAIETEVLEPPSPSQSPPLSESSVSSGFSSGRTSPSLTSDDELATMRRSRPGSGIIDTSSIEHNLKPVGVRKSDNLLGNPVQKTNSVRALLSRSNSLARPSDDPK